MFAVFVQNFEILVFEILVEAIKSEKNEPYRRCLEYSFYITLESKFYQQTIK